MIPAYGPDCDLCVPDAHYLLTCPTCGRQWDEPPTPGKFKCVCGVEVEVTSEDDKAWQRDVLGIASPW